MSIMGFLKQKQNIYIYIYIYKNKRNTKPKFLNGSIYALLHFTVCILANMFFLLGSSLGHSLPAEKIRLCCVNSE